MPEDAAARRVVTAADIARLAGLLDRFEHALDPEAPATRQAELDFEAGVQELFTACVRPFYATITYPQFRGHVRWHCRAWLAVEACKPPISL